MQKSAAGPGKWAHGPTRYHHPPATEDFEERIVDIDVAEEMRGSFLEYAYSVIYRARCPTPGTG